MYPYNPQIFVPRLRLYCRNRPSSFILQAASRCYLNYSALLELYAYRFFIVTDGSVAHQVGGLGSEVLQMVFKFHRIAQQEVLSQLLNRIITGCNSAAVDSYFSEWGGWG